MKRRKEPSSPSWRSCKSRTLACIWSRRTRPRPIENRRGGSGLTPIHLILFLALKENCNSDPPPPFFFFTQLRVWFQLCLASNVVLIFRKDSISWRTNQDVSCHLMLALPHCIFLIPVNSNDVSLKHMASKDSRLNLQETKLEKNKPNENKNLIHKSGLH